MKVKQICDHSNFNLLWSADLYSLWSTDAQLQSLFSPLKTAQTIAEIQFHKTLLN